MRFIGIQIKQIEDYLTNLSFSKKDRQCNYNILIKSSSIYEENIDNFIQCIYENLLLYKIIKGKCQKLDLDEGAELSEIEHDSELIILYSDKRHKNIDTMKNSIIDYIKKDDSKVFIIIDNSDTTRMNMIRASLGRRLFSVVH